MKVAKGVASDFFYVSANADGRPAPSATQKISLFRS
jgi:hypothetical protein